MTTEQLNFINRLCRLGKHLYVNDHAIINLQAPPFTHLRHRVYTHYMYMIPILNKILDGESFYVDACEMRYDNNNSIFYRVSDKR